MDHLTAALQGPQNVPAAVRQPSGKKLETLLLLLLLLLPCSTPRQPSPRCHCLDCSLAPFPCAAPLSVSPPPSCTASGSPSCLSPVKLRSGQRGHLCRNVLPVRSRSSRDEHVLRGDRSMRTLTSLQPDRSRSLHHSPSDHQVRLGQWARTGFGEQRGKDQLRCFARSTRLRWSD